MKEFVMSKKITVYDPAMCCSTGVCGPSVDPKLAEFSADLDWLQKQDIAVERYNLAQQPQAFVENKQIAVELQKDAECLPLVLVDGEIVARGFYPDRTALAKLCGVNAETEINTTSSCGCKPGSCC